MIERAVHHVTENVYQKNKNKPKVKQHVYNIPCFGQYTPPPPKKNDNNKSKVGHLKKKNNNNLPGQKESTLLTSPRHKKKNIAQPVLGVILKIGTFLLSAERCLLQCYTV